MSSRGTVTVLGLSALAGLVAFAAWPEEAKAEERKPDLPPIPEAPTSMPTPEPDSPEDIRQNYEAAQRQEYPWMTYSARTLAIQGAINSWRAEVGQSPIVEDGILGPMTCAAWKDWANNAYYAVWPPASCSGATRGRHTARTGACSECTGRRPRY